MTLRGFWMQVGFESRSVGDLCNSGYQLVRALGEDAAENVKDLLFYLDAAPTLADLTRSPPILRDQVPSQDSPLFTVGKAGTGQVLFRPTKKGIGQVLADIRSVSVISVGGKV